MAYVIDLNTGEPVEQRKEGRHRTLKGAKLSFYGGYCSFEGIVRNQSQNGARLDFGDTTGVPPEFSLAISGEAAKRTARVCWHSPTSVGVCFVEA
ncbi:hypothetical protein [Aminobacter sp. AP02]|uniref:hypothetical protein n=1 Tax=Aminobacter sp. AP02 TaxID=2135737 RepID=UPI000D6D53A3|nr:hypothetical protein [Aminobacter sp. AP02]PWK72663.1 hypothetical protein C8K44_105104 [Aminobacter sp. AP02]